MSKEQYQYNCQNGFKLVVYAYDDYQGEVVAVIPNPKGGNSHSVQFDCGKEIQYVSICKIITPEGVVFEDEFGWLPLIRAGMVSGVSSEIADKLETCLNAHKAYKAAIEAAEEAYRAITDPLTDDDSSGNYHDTEEWRYVPGFPVVRFYD